MKDAHPTPTLDRSDITHLLRQWQDGDLAARARLFEAVYGQVRAIAGRALRAAPNVTLTPTDLAHEALIRFLGAQASWEDRRHFYNVVAQATRQILIDTARRRLRDKHGGGARPIDLESADGIADADDQTLVRVNDAIEALTARDPRSAQIVELTYFGGFDREEIARSMALSVATVDRDLRFARAWLKRALLE